MRAERIPYTADASGLFAHIRDWPWAQLLDSAGVGRYDILVADPWCWLLSRNGVTEQHRRSGLFSRHDGDPFALLAELLGPASAEPQALPFIGGALGYFGYDLGYRLHGIQPRTPRGQIPQLALGLYDWAVVLDHRDRRGWLVSAGRDPMTAARWSSLLSLFAMPAAVVAEDPPLRPAGALRVDLDRAAYGSGFARIQRYLRDGDCYQVNYARRFELPVEGDGWAAYCRLRRNNPVPFGAYGRYPFGEVLCASPERFLQLCGRQVSTSPIKGTRPRAADPAEDLRLRAALLGSTKDRAENLMIVDLLRNDIGQVCRPGSVRVPALFAVKSFPSVHHLVSTVSGELAEGIGPTDLLRACFPGGSITGAPKRRAMQIIDELETGSRGLYCGSIGYIGHDGQMDSNIAIRTLLLRDGLAEFQAGGGIVADSDCAAEYAETAHKARPFFDLLGVEGDAG